MTPGEILALLLSLLIGLSLGLFGGGGSILAVPVLVYVAGVSTKVAIAMSLAIVGITSLWAGSMHHRQKNVDWPMALAFGLAGMVGAWGGARLTALVSDVMLLFLFAVLMLIVGSLMFFRKERQESTAKDLPSQSRLKIIFKIFPVGLGVGVLTGFLGIGGGFLIVPALVLVTHLPMRRAVGTSLVVISLNAFSGFLGHLDKPIPLGLTAIFTFAAILGSVVGTRLAHAMHPGRLRKGFAVFVVIVGGVILIRNWHVFL